MKDEDIEVDDAARLIRSLKIEIVEDHERRAWSFHAALTTGEQWEREQDTVSIVCHADGRCDADVIPDLIARAVREVLKSGIEKIRRAAAEREAFLSLRPHQRDAYVDLLLDHEQLINLPTAELLELAATERKGDD